MLKSASVQANDTVSDVCYLSGKCDFPTED